MWLVRVPARESDLISLTSTVTALSSTVSTISGNLATLSSQTSTNTTNIAANTSAITSLQTRMTAAEAAILALQVLIPTNPQTAAPTTGQTVTVVPQGAVRSCLIAPSGLLAALTITLNNGLFAGQVQNVTLTQSITLLTWTSTNIAGGLSLPTTLLGTLSVGFVWDASTSKWRRFA